MNEPLQLYADASISDADPAGTPSQSRGPDEQLLDELIFKQDLNEVHMFRAAPTDR